MLECRRRRRLKARIRKDLEGSGRGLSEILFRNFTGEIEEHDEDPRDTRLFVRDSNQGSPEYRCSALSQLTHCVRFHSSFTWM